MNYKVVPFVAKITQSDSTRAVAGQLQDVINQYAIEGWEYVRLESVETNVTGTDGCFGIGAKPGYTTSFSMVVFKQP